MMRLNNGCIMLEGVVCRACYAKYRKFCPSSIYPYCERLGWAILDPTVETEASSARRTTTA
jgi:hypothetical protein